MLRVRQKFDQVKNMVKTKNKIWVNANSEELINCSTELKYKVKKDKLRLRLALGKEGRREGKEGGRVGRQAGRKGGRQGRREGGRKEGRKEVGRRELNLSSAQCWGGDSANYCCHGKLQIAESLELMLIFQFYVLAIFDSTF